MSLIKDIIFIIDDKSQLYCFQSSKQSNSEFSLLKETEQRVYKSTKTTYSEFSLLK